MSETDKQTNNMVEENCTVELTHSSIAAVVTKISLQGDERKHEAWQCQADIQYE